MSSYYYHALNYHLVGQRQQQARQVYSTLPAPALLPAYCAGDPVLLGGNQTAVAPPGLPLYVGIARGDLRVHLSEHTGDAHPDGLLYLYVDDVDVVAADFGVVAELAYYGMREIELTDPDGNRLRIGTPAAG